MDKSVRSVWPRYGGLKVFFVIVLGSMLTAEAQNLDAEAITKATALKVSGGVSANTIFYNANTRNAREPFTYFLQGNLNLSWLTFSMPLSYSFSNQGTNLGYDLPFNFNRLSLHPKYKWVQAHVGDVAMTFSPYTLSGHQFTGGGLELTPKGPFKISAMAGRLLKATENNGNPQTLPAFKRMGYGLQMAYKKNNYNIGLIGFYAKDKANSIDQVPDDKNIAPKENLVLSIGGEATFAKNYRLRMEYASTAITQDTRAESQEGSGHGLTGLFFSPKASTEYYDAINTGIDLSFSEMQLGLGYERIDPGYETLGAYFFNNDFENITLNASRPFFNNKLNLSFNVGYQSDNLDHQKSQDTNRFVGSFNASLQVSERITITGGYSNFSTFTNQSLNQFDDINDSDLTDEDLEALDFKQLAQNANINLNWLLTQGKKTTQNINLNYALASSANEQGGVIRQGQANNFHNTNAVYTIGLPKRNLNISSSLNYTYSDVGRDDSNAWGTTVEVGKKLFENKLNTSLGMAYNTSKNLTVKTDVVNFRYNASLTVAKKHNFNLNVVQLYRNTADQATLNEFTLTFGYGYTFDLGKAAGRN